MKKCTVREQNDTLIHEELRSSRNNKEKWYKKKEERDNSCMITSATTVVVAYGGKQQKDEVLIIRLIKEAWELLLLSTNQLASKLFNDNYACMSFMYFCCIIIEGN